MGKWMNKTINPSDVPESEDHILVEDLARLAEGAVHAPERQHLIGHLNRCQRCFQILQETLKDVSAETTLQPGSVPWWKTLDPTPSGHFGLTGFGSGAKEYPAGR